MEFFTELSKHFDENTRLTIGIIRNKIGELKISILPQITSKEKEIKELQISPLLISGRPGEVDKAFFETITAALETQSGIVSNIEQYKASLKKQGNKATGKNIFYRSKFMCEKNLL